MEVVKNFHHQVGLGNARSGPGPCLITSRVSVIRNKGIFQEQN